jgi:predicted XRE-type DNA-binding protein
MGASTEFKSAWDAIADTPEQADNLHARAQLMCQIAAIIDSSGWTQAEAAEQAGVTEPRINDLLRARVSSFFLDTLVNIATTLGRSLHIKVDAA